jgi:hypothetical protein
MQDKFGHRDLNSIYNFAMIIIISHSLSVNPDRTTWQGRGLTRAKFNDPLLSAVQRNMIFGAAAADR